MRSMTKLIAIQLFLISSTPFASPQQENESQTVLLVYGSDVSSESWDPLVNTLREHQGPKTTIVRFPVRLDKGVRKASISLKQKIDEMVPTPIHIVSHGRGAIVARDCLEKLYEKPQVQSLMMIAPPNRGSSVEPEELQPGSGFLRALNAEPWKPARGVSYMIWAGTRPTPGSRGEDFESLPGGGDGVVSVENAFLKDVLFQTVHFDHFEIHRKSQLVQQQIRSALDLKCKPNPAATFLDFFPDKKGKMQKFLGFGALELNKSGTRLAAGNEKGEIFIYNILTGKTDNRLSIQNIDRDSGGIRSIAFHPDGNRLFSTLGQIEILPGLRIWNLSDGSHKDIFNPRKDPVVQFEMDGSGNRLLIKSYTDKVSPDISLWDVEKGETIWELLPQHKRTRSLALSHDGKFAATGGDGKIFLFNAETEERLRTFSASADQGSIKGLKFSPDGKLLGSISENRAKFGPNLVIRNTSTGQTVKTLFLGAWNDVETLVFSPDGKTLMAACRDGIKFWDTETWNEMGMLIPHYTTHWGLDISADGKKLVSGGFGPLILWDLPKALSWKGCSETDHSNDIYKELSFPVWDWMKISNFVDVGLNEIEASFRLDSLIREWKLSVQLRRKDARKFTFKSSAKDPNGNKVRLVFDWDDGTPLQNSAWVPSGQTVEFTHAWVIPGVYTVRCYAVNPGGIRSLWSETAKITIKGKYKVPSAPKIKLSQREIKIRESVGISVQSRDPDGHRIIYEFDFGDGELADTTGFSGRVAKYKHKWQYPGRYQLRVRALDGWVSHSDWSTVEIVVRGNPNDHICPNNILPPAWGIVGKEMIIRAQIPMDGPASRIQFQFGSPPDKRVTWESKTHPPGTWVTARYACPKLQGTKDQKLKIRIRSKGENRLPTSRWKILHIPIKEGTESIILRAGNEPPEIPTKPEGPTEGEWRTP